MSFIIGVPKPSGVWANTPPQKLLIDDLKNYLIAQKCSKTTRNIYCLAWLCSTFFRNLTA